MILMLTFLIIITFLQKIPIILLGRVTLIIIIVVVIYLSYYYFVIDQGLELYQKRRKFIYNLMDYMQVIISAFMLMQIIFSFWFFPAKVNQTSMNPYLYEGERIIVFHESNQIERFDVVIFRVDASIQASIQPSENGELWVKRVIGLPGEDIDFIDGKLYVNGHLVWEPYLYDQDGLINQGGYFDEQGFYHTYNSYTQDITLDDILNRTNLEGTTIPEGYYLLMGDNRSFSKDSREVGLVPITQIIGEGRYIIRNLFQWEKIGA